jgi:hypothetical protein
MKIDFVLDLFDAILREDWDEIIKISRELAESENKKGNHLNASKLKHVINLIEKDLDDSSIVIYPSKSQSETMSSKYNMEDMFDCINDFALLAKEFPTHGYNGLFFKDILTKYSYLISPKDSNKRIETKYDFNNNLLKIKELTYNQLQSLWFFYDSYSFINISNIQEINIDPKNKIIVNNKETILVNVITNLRNINTTIDHIKSLINEEN